jgi:hypothetical protein
VYKYEDLIQLVKESDRSEQAMKLRVQKAEDSAKGFATSSTSIQDITCLLITGRPYIIYWFTWRRFVNCISHNASNRNVITNNFTDLLWERHVYVN